MTVIENPAPLVAQAPDHIRNLSGADPVAGDHSKHNEQTYGRNKRKGEGHGPTVSGGRVSVGGYPSEVQQRQVVYEGNHRHSENRINVSNEAGITLEEQLTSFNSLVETLTADTSLPEHKGLDWSTSSHKLQESAVQQFSNILQTDEGFENFTQVLGTKSNSELDKVKDLKSNAFNKLGLGIFRDEVANNNLGELARQTTAKLIKALNSKDTSDIEEKVSAITKTIEEKDIDDLTKNALLVVVTTGALAAAVIELKKKGKVKNIAPAALAVSLLLSACGGSGQPGEVPTPTSTYSADTVPLTSGQATDVNAEQGQQKTPVPVQTPKPTEIQGQTLPGTGGEPTDPEKTALAKEQHERETQESEAEETEAVETQEFTQTPEAKVEYSTVEEAKASIENFFIEFEAGKYKDTSGSEYFRFGDYNTKVGIDYIIVAKPQKFGSFPGVELNTAFMTPAILDIFTNNENISIAFGAVDAKGEPFVWIGEVAKLDPENYPNYNRRIWYVSTRSDNPDTIRYSRQDLSVLNRAMQKIKGNPVYVPVNAYTIIDENKFNNFSPEGLTPVEIEYWKTNSRYELISSLFQVYEGKQNVQPGYVFRDNDDFNRIGYIKEKPLIHQIMVLIPPNEDD